MGRTALWVYCECVGRGVDVGGVGGVDKVDDVAGAGSEGDLGHLYALLRRRDVLCNLPRNGLARLDVWGLSARNTHSERPVERGAVGVRDEHRYGARVVRVVGPGDRVVHSVHPTKSELDLAPFIREIYPCSRTSRHLYSDR